MTPPSPDEQLRLLLLGTPRVVLPGGGDAGLPLGKPLAALCYVAMETTRVTRDDLASVLWSGAPGPRGRQSVRQALWMLRKAAGDDVVVEIDGVLHLGPDVVTDLDLLGERLAAGDLDAAWQQWKGGPLRGLAVPDSPAFQGWADDVRSRWEMRMGEALLARAEAEVVAEERLPWIERALEVQPYSEVLHHARVRAYLEQRDVEGAETALDEARAGVDEPTPGLFEELAERLRALRRTRFAENDDDRLIPEFVGRAEEFSHLASLWRSALSSRPRSVALVGPMGIGKTRLAEEFLALAESDGARVVAVKAVETERTLELGVASSLAREMLRLPGGAGISAASAQALQHLVPSSGNGVPPGGGPPSPAALADAVEDLVEAVAHEVPLVLMVDDLQWVDSGSRTLFLRLARTLRNSRAMLLLTSRTGEGDAGALRALRSLGEQERARVIELEPLSEREIEEMVGLLLSDEGRSDTTQLADQLTRLSGGTPLVVVELLQVLVDRKVLARHEDQWRLEHPTRLDDIPLPTNIHDLLAARLAHLDDPQRRILVAVARGDHAMRPPALAAALDRPVDDVVEALAHLESRGLLRRSRQGELALAHDSLRDPLYRLDTAQERGVRTGDRPTAPDRDRTFSPGLLLLAAAALLVFALFATRPPATNAVAQVEHPTGRIGLQELQNPGVTQLTFGPDGQVSEERFRHPEQLSIAAASVRITPEGDTVWLGSVGNHDLAPDVVEVRSDGRVEPILAAPGDQTPAWFSWSSRWALVQSQDSTSPRFRLDLVLVDRERGTTRTLVRPGYMPMGVDVSADGSRLVTLTETLEGPDSIVVFTPAGRQLHALEVERNLYEVIRWCGDEWFAVRVEPGRLSEAVVIDPESGAARPLPIPESTEHRFAVCSPDGRHIASVDASGRRLVVVARETGETVLTRTLPHRVRLGYWHSDTWRSLPRHLAITDSVRELASGGAERIRAYARLEDGSTDSSQVVFRSLDPQVVRTAGDSVYGIRPGVGQVEVSARDWLLDTLSVTVRGEPQAAALLVDPLERVDPDTWPHRVGDGFARPATVDDERVLEVGSDSVARYLDGLVSRELEPRPEGITVEVDFRLEVTRNDKQGLEVAIVWSDPPSDPSRRGWFRDWTTYAGVSFKYPGAELGSFEDRMGSVVADGIPLYRIPLPGFPKRPDTWTRLTLQVAPDGLVSVLVDGTPVSMDPLRTEVLKGRPRILFSTRAVDTHLYLRDLVVWPGVRYDVPAPDEMN